MADHHSFGDCLVFTGVQTLTFTVSILCVPDKKTKETNVSLAACIIIVTLYHSVTIITVWCRDGGGAPALLASSVGVRMRHASATTHLQRFMQMTITSGTWRSYAARVLCKVADLQAESTSAARLSPVDRVLFRADSEGDRDSRWKALY
jgi:hypothetical protein